MLSVCAGAEPRLDEILEALLAELADGKDEHIRLIESCGLDTFLWERLKRSFGYQSKTPGMQDFAIELFKSCYAMGVGMQTAFRPDALVFLKRWKDSLSHHRSFETLSEQFAEILTIERDLQGRDYRSLLEMDLFRLIDQKIVSDLARSVAERTISAEDCASAVRLRRRSHWYADFEHLYNTIDYAAQFLAALDASRLAVNSLAGGIQGYVQSWHRLDQLYRKVIYHARKSGQVSLLEQLVGLVENLYTNNYLLKLNDNWQTVIDSCHRWEADPVTLQRDFYTKWILPFVQNRKKIYVIISDALRYEVAEELLGRVRQEDRYEAQLEAASIDAS